MESLRSSQTGCIRTFDMLHVINRRRAYDISQSMRPCFGANQNVEDWSRGVLPGQSFDVCNILSNTAFKMMEACLAKIAYAIRKVRQSCLKGVSELLRAGCLSMIYG